MSILITGKSKQEEHKDSDGSNPDDATKPVLYVLKLGINDIYMSELVSNGIRAKMLLWGDVVECDISNYITDQGIFNVPMDDLWRMTDQYKPIHILLVCGGSFTHDGSFAQTVDLEINTGKGKQIMLSELCTAIKESSNGPIHMILQNHHAGLITANAVSTLPEDSILVAVRGSWNIVNWFALYEKYWTHFPQWSWIEVMHCMYCMFATTIDARLWVNGDLIGDQSKMYPRFERCLMGELPCTASEHPGMSRIVPAPWIQAATSAMNSFSDKITQDGDVNHWIFSPTDVHIHTVLTLECWGGDFRRAFDGAAQRLLDGELVRGELVQLIPFRDIRGIVQQYMF
jgi:hypothetical protein